MQANINWFESRVNLAPFDTAIVDSKTNDSWTYQDLNQRAGMLANYLLKQGIQKGDRIALLSPNHISYFDFVLASMKIGTIFVPLNNRLAHSELMYVIKDCDPKILGLGPSLKNHLKQDEIGLQVMDIPDNN